ncbi:extracellular solute-binding protein [Candidatus Aerophobetes bacterium]|nr:extracellular solute-binding protein [Candidatus Aerophobetes bacterium]
MKKLGKVITVLLVISLSVSLLVGFTTIALAKETKKTVEITPLDWYPWLTEKTMLEIFNEHTTKADAWPWAFRYATALFIITHPEVKINFETEKQWPRGSTPQEKLITAMASGEAPSYYSLGVLTGTPETDIAEGYAADITDLVDKWKFKDFLKENWWSVWQRAWKNGRCYALPAVWYTGSDMIYRRDLFKAAGLFNEEGKPGPSINWTMDDFRTICQKLTDPKKQIWGFAMTGDVIKYSRSIKNFFDAFGVPRVIPDRSGKYTWRSALDIPEVQPLLKFWYDMVWKDKSVLVYPPGEPLYSGQETPNGRVAITYWLNSTAAQSRAINSTDLLAGPSFYHIKGTPEDMPFYKSCGPVPFPVGPEGIRLNLITAGLMGFNPTLDKDQLKAAFEFYTWMWGGGEGYKILLEQTRIVSKHPEVAVQMMPYLYPYPGKPKKEVVPEWAKIEEIEKSFPTAPLPSAYNLVVNLQNSVLPLFDTIIHDPKVDLQKVARETANRINKGVLNYKVKGQTVKNYKDYYTDLATFYKENFPEYYEKTFKNLFEKYYKVW